MKRRRPASMSKSNLCIFCIAQHLRLVSQQVMHLARCHHCEAHQIPSTIGLCPKVGQRVRLPPKRLQLDCSKSRCASCSTFSHIRHRLCNALYLPPHPGSSKADRGQVGHFCCYNLDCNPTPCSQKVCLQLCIRCCEPHSYHERPHTYANNPPTPGLRLARGSEDAAQVVQGQQPDHPKALDAL